MRGAWQLLNSLLEWLICKSSSIRGFDDASIIRLAAVSRLSNQVVYTIIQPIHRLSSQARHMRNRNGLEPQAYLGELGKARELWVSLVHCTPTLHLLQDGRKPLCKRRREEGGKNGDERHGADCPAQTMMRGSEHSTSKSELLFKMGLLPLLLLVSFSVKQQLLGGNRGIADICP